MSLKLLPQGVYIGSENDRMNWCNKNLLRHIKYKGVAFDLGHSTSLWRQRMYSGNHAVYFLCFLYSFFSKNLLLADLEEKLLAWASMAGFIGEDSKLQVKQCNGLLERPVKDLWVIGLLIKNFCALLKNKKWWRVKVVLNYYLMCPDRLNGIYVYL